MKRMKFGSIFTMFLGLVALMSGLAGCEDKITEGEIPMDNEKLVTVPLAFDFAPETDGYEIASGSPRARLGLASEVVSKLWHNLFYAQSPDFRKPGLCYYPKFLYL